MKSVLKKIWQGVTAHAKKTSTQGKVKHNSTPFEVEMETDAESDLLNKVKSVERIPKNRTTKEE